MKLQLIPRLALGATLLVLPAAGFVGTGGEGTDKTFSKEAHAELATLFTKAMADAKADVTYECNGKCSEEGCTEACPYMTSPRVKLTKMVVKQPLALKAMQPLALEAMANSKTGDAEADLVFGLLFDARTATATTVAEAIYGKAPKRFNAKTLVGFCEMGSNELVEPLHNAVKKGDGGVVAATFLASKGDDVGKRILKKALKTKDVTLDNALEVLVAGIGLDHLGDERALQAAHVRVHDAAIAALDAGELDIARSLAVRASVCRSSAGSSSAILSSLSKSCKETEKKAAAHDKLVTADQIFELIQEATPIG